MLTSITTCHFTIKRRERRTINGFHSSNHIFHYSYHNHTTVNAAHKRRRKRHILWVCIFRVTANKNINDWTPVYGFYPILHTGWTRRCMLGKNQENCRQKGRGNGCQIRHIERIIRIIFLELRTHNIVSMRRVIMFRRPFKYRKHRRWTRCQDLGSNDGNFILKSPARNRNVI